MRLNVLFSLLVLVSFFTNCTVSRDAIITTIKYKNGNIKLESRESKGLFNSKCIIHTDKAYYDTGQIKSELKSKYGTPKTNTVGLGQPSKFSLMLYKKYKLYHLNGKLKERGKLVRGSGIIEEFNDIGKLVKRKKIENFINSDEHGFQ